MTHFAWPFAGHAEPDAPTPFKHVHCFVAHRRSASAVGASVSYSCAAQRAWAWQASPTRKWPAPSQLAQAPAPCAAHAGWGVPLGQAQTFFSQVSLALARWYVLSQRRHMDEACVGHSRPVAAWPLGQTHRFMAHRRSEVRVGASVSNCKLAHELMAEHWRSLVPTAGFDSHCPAAQMVCARQVRSDTLVGAAVSYSVPTQMVFSWHRRSCVALPVRVSCCVLVHTVCAVHTRSADADGAWISWLPAPHSVSAEHTRSLCTVGAVLSNWVLASHAAVSALQP